MTEIKTQGRFTLLLISFLFFAPIMAAMYLYFSDNTWRPAMSTQRGELVTPPVSLPDVSLAPTQGDYRLREVWSLLVLTGAECDTPCMTALTDTHQIRMSLGPKMTRLQNVLVPAANAVHLSENDFPRLIITEGETGAAIAGRIDEWQEGQIFLVDPFGNLMMSYAPGTEKGDIRKDLGHLLKISVIG